MLHLSLFACTGYQLQLASSSYKTTTGSAPPFFHSLLRIYIPSRSPAYFHSLLRIYIASRSLRSAHRDHHREAQNHFPEHSHSPLLAGGMILITDTRYYRPWVGGGKSETLCVIELGFLLMSFLWLYTIRDPLLGCTFDPPVEKHCNRLCLTHRRVTIRSTEKYRNSTLI